MQIVLFNKLRDRSSCAHVTAVDFGGKISFFVRSFLITCSVFINTFRRAQVLLSQINQTQVNQTQVNQTQVN